MEMKSNMKGRSFISIHDFTADEINYILEIGKQLKTMQKRGVSHRYLAGKTLGMIFQKSSTRTRVAFEVGDRKSVV